MGISNSKVKPAVAEPAVPQNRKKSMELTVPVCLSRTDSGMVEVKPGVYILQTNIAATKWAKTNQAIIPEINPVTRLPTFSPASGIQEDSTVPNKMRNELPKGASIQTDSWYSAPRPKLRIKV